MQGDRLSQLQERVHWMSNQYYTYVGVLQRDAPPKFDDPGEALEVDVDGMREGG